MESAWSNGKPAYRCPHGRTSAMAPTPWPEPGTHKLRSRKSACASRPSPFRPVAIRSVYADGDTVIVVWDGRGIATDGLPYENSYVWIMRLNDGQVIDGTAFYDSISFNDLWARVQSADVIAS